MTTKQFIITILITGVLIFIAGGMLLAESQPVSLEGRALKIEMDAYIDKFTDEVGITDASMQWVVMVLPILEMDSPAVTYGWLLPPPHRYHEGDPSIWVAMFTFQEDMMLLMDPKMRRVVAGHEVAHMMGKCMNFREPDLRGLEELEALILQFNYAVILESCADIISAELTSTEDVLTTLRFLKKTWGPDNIVLAKRIQVIERVLEREIQQTKGMETNE